MTSHTTCRHKKAAFTDIMIIVIIVVCKAPSLRLKQLNKSNVTHVTSSRWKMLSV